jgi:uncharacterized membrane protein (UPF0182 family)
VTRRRAVIGTIAVAALVLLAGRWASQQYTDALWFDALGARDVWNARFVNGLALRLGSFLAASAFTFLNLYAVRQSVVSLVLPRRIANIEIGEEVPSRYLLIATALLSALIGSALTLSGDLWWVLLRARIGQPFGEADPYFGADLGFFVYWLPFETELYYWAMVMLLVVIGVVILLYALTPSLRWSRGALYVSTYVRRHFTMLGGVLLLALAWSYRLSMYRLLAEGGGTGSFGSIDHRVTVPVLLVLSLVTLCAAMVVLWAGWTGQMRLAFFAVSAVLLLSLIGRTVAPLVVHPPTDPAAAEKQERPYVATRLGYTRRAYGVDRVHVDSANTGFTSTSELAPRVGVWDATTLMRYTERERHVDIVGTGAGWTAGPNGLSAFLVERGEAAVGDGGEFWGIARYDAAAADEHGEPVRAPSGMGLGDETTLDEPIVSDSAPGYSVVSDSLQRIAGVEMVSTRSRLAHSWALQNFRLLFGDLPATRPMIVRHRDIRERITQLAPFFVQGSEILPVVVADSLYWTLELYVASDDYPLAERFNILDAQRGYFQHAATALVHAASGRVRLVLAPAPEIVTKSWVDQFPSLFVRPTALSRQLQAALPPVLDGARAQALAFASAGFRGDSLEVRHFAALDAADSLASHEPLHVALPNLGVVTSWTLLDAQDHVRGIVAAAGGTRETSWIPLAPDGERWGSTGDRLRAADTSLHEGPVIHAPVRVVPLSGLPMYFQAAFRARAGASPTLARVAAVTGDSLRSAPTLAAALGLATATTATGPARQVDVRARAESLYRDMRDALRRGDWPAFGRAFESLGGALRVAPR